MEIVPLTKNKYQEWDDFCLESPDAWFWHSTSWLEYSLNYRPEFNSTSLSFMVTENKEILAICPLILEIRNGIKEFAFGGEMTWTPAPAFADLSPKKREKVINFTFEHIDKLALENKIDWTYLVIPPLTFPRYNYLMKQGYIDISLNTQVVDLTQDLKAIHSAMRKGHDYDTDRGLRYLEITIFDKDNITRDVFDGYCYLLHIDPSHTYETRPQVTFDMMYDWILQGNAILVSALLPMDTTASFTSTKMRKYIGFSYITTYKKKAYYGSACSDPEYHQMPIGHTLTWRTIEWLKENGFKYYELGWQQYGNLPYDMPSKKEVEISFFKRGFGGFTVPLFRGEKYYSADYYLKINTERINKYANYLMKKEEK